MNKSIATAALGLLLAALGLSAQTIALNADVPFDFRVGDRLMPAGRYKVRSASGLLTVRAANDASQASMSYARQEISLERKPPALVFHRYQDQSFLATVWGPYGLSGVALPLSKTEKEARLRIHDPSAVEISATAVRP